MTTLLIAIVTFPAFTVEQPALSAAARWNVVEAGAVGDGKTDNTATFQRLLNEAGQAGGGVVAVSVGRYLRGWHGRERIATRTMRWSTTGSRLSLPVVPGKPYTLSLELNVPEAAAAPDAGLYRDGKRLASFKPGATTLTLELPSSRTERVALEVICKGWIPRKVIAGSQDDRTLGVTLYAVTVRAKGAKNRIFSANTGEFFR